MCCVTEGQRYTLGSTLQYYIHAFYLGYPPNYLNLYLLNLPVVSSRLYIFIFLFSIIHSFPVFPPTYTINKLPPTHAYAYRQ
ncbi:hypothetical protein F4809DRAFT_447112 [Biscogniauxia mediterranea]|nr:hypothetical protein F4809DRAFT_447112 [Biscogniauxia mediterranea]